MFFLVYYIAGGKNGDSAPYGCSVEWRRLQLYFFMEILSDSS